MQEFDEEMYRQLIAYPTEIFLLMEEELNSIAQERFPELYGEDGLRPTVQARPFNLKKTTPMRELDPEG
jgi:DNA replicative helicase MCM subunit Mcm2 (Cdc46/Mcm family)